MKRTLQKIKRYLLHKKVLRNLIKRYQIQYETELVLEQWIINCITNKQQVERRKELTEKQGAINEIKNFIEYLKLQK